MTDAPRPATILDCTIRDGSYAIDFKFTAQDTALVAKLLDAAGLRYIEVGHGLGLGATEAGKGAAASRDLEVITQTRAAVDDAKIGAFYIPDIGTPAMLAEAAAAGMDFVRIGNNADEMEGAWASVESAREAGLEVFVNFMKTYGIDPTEFAEAASVAASYGARGVYIVDSAGGMMPHEVQRYVEATREKCGDRLEIGFHGHSNLHLAVANSIAAYEAGAQLVDTSVWGIGRSSGNVPTEVMAAVFDRLGVPCGVDALDIVDLAESYLRPLAEHLHPHDMTAVALGYGRFHSSFLPTAERAAAQSGVNPFRLIVGLGRRDVMRLSSELLDDVLEELAEAPAPEVRSDLARFSHPSFGPRRIGNRAQAVGDLLDGLEVVAAKRHLAVVVDLVRADALDEETTTAEFLLEDDYAAIGRVRFGSAEAAIDALAPHAERIDLTLFDLDGEPAGVTSLPDLGSLLGSRLLPYRSSELELEHLADVALGMIASGAPGRIVLLDPGAYPAADVDRLATRLGRVASVERSVTPGGEALVIVAGPRGSVAEIDREARALYIGPTSDGDAVAPGIVLGRDDAYRNQAPRWLLALDAAGRAGSSVGTGSRDAQ